MSRFIRPEIQTLTISNGDTLIVKRRLNTGEQRATFARMYIAGVDGMLKVNPLQTGLAMVTAYLLDWSLTDDDGKPVVIRDQSLSTVESALDALDPESFTEIRDAIDAHVSAMTAERDAEKNGTGGEKNTPGISPSPVGAAGASSGFVN